MRYLLIASLVSIVFGGFVGREITNAAHNRELIEEQRVEIGKLNARADEILAMVERGNNVSLGLEERLSQMKVLTMTVAPVIQKEIRQTVYAECVLPDSGVDLLNRHMAEGRTLLTKREGR